MREYPEKLTLIFRILIVTLLVTGGVFLVSYIASNQVQAKDFAAVSQENTKSISSTNIFNSLDGVGNNISKLQQSTVSGFKSGTDALKSGGSAVVSTTGNSVVAVGRGIGVGIQVIGKALGAGMGLALRTPGNAVGAVLSISAVDSVIRPEYNTEVPIIDPNSPDLLAAIEALPPSSDSNNKNGPVWPLLGRVTTDFGVPHWPFQETHSGIDISDNTLPGETQIKPFRPGKVIETNFSNYGLGNHVIIDHGGGITSVYAHLDSIAVKVGQEVTLDTILGQEGTTGLSTGTHLHFEIRVNGQATDPHNFISGQP